MERGAFGRWLKLERELWRLAFLGWRQRPPKVAADLDFGQAVFTHHRQVHWDLIAGVLSALVVIEGAVVHLWLDGAGYTVAMWLALALHVYLLVWILGDAQALRLYTTRVGSLVDADRIVSLRVGLRGSADIPVARIVGATPGTWDEPAPGGELVTVSGFANVSLTFDSPVEFVPMLGKPVEVSSLRVQVDDPERFVRSMRP